MGLSVWQIAIVGILVVLLFGRGKISDLMGDVAKGIKSFKKGMKDDDEEVATTIDHEASTVNARETEKTRAS
ncbi:MAG: twin-arginine translocase TatA/TatE family subunit [Pseudomonadota bacterium]